MSSLSDHVAFFLGTHGPSFTLDTACSSSLVALAMAVATLRKGDCDYAIVTCVNLPQHKDFHLALQVGRGHPEIKLCLHRLDRSTL
jgi:acyl transferase domain-containing protein